MTRQPNESEIVNRYCCGEDIASQNAAEIEDLFNEIDRLEADLAMATDDQEKEEIQRNLDSAWKRYNIVITRLGL